MRISVLSSKGGVGKSTVAISLSKVLAMMGFPVLLVDRDLVGYASYTAGIKGPGLVSSVSDGIESTVYRDIAVGKGSVTVLKYFGDGPRYKTDIDKFHMDSKLGDKGWAIYTRILRMKEYSFVIVDNAQLVRPEDDIVKHELEKFKEVYPGFPIWQLFVSDSLNRTIEDNIAYAESIGSVRDGTMLGFIINMIRPGEAERFRGVLDNAMKRLNARFGALLPFSEDLFQFTGTFEEFPVLPEIKDFALKVASLRAR
ncbi:AAA family ATPase [Metallosphaera javensis (ex Sakai et al. 2022)]|uniref:nucleotide-binding protein n=1 Tax=Metallosphaera javensis (ex Sakai et al. 2022) TaxID=2775498 RepID=UPI0025853433|nr:MAG: iron-sulfur cluster carrier protein [Metallosphaera javensis (ex Sakai et al. 2022)]